MDPERVHKLLRVITDFLKAWHDLQRKTIPTIDGIMMLDDIVGFVGEEEFMEFGYPYLKELYNTNVSVKLFHNDADCSMSVKYYHEIGINLYNPGTHMSLAELKEATQNNVVILGNIPPRDVLAAGSEADVQKSVRDMLDSISDHSHIMPSCGGGMPPNVSSANINAFLQEVKK
jgi:uroporphyrinogen decarboxylase